MSHKGAEFAPGELKWRLMPRRRDGARQRRGLGRTARLPAADLGARIDRGPLRSRPMLLAALTGGIGSGKSTVADGFSKRGAVIINADAIGREILEPGGLAYQAVVDRFGPGVVLSDGAIDRPALAAVVFSDQAALADLNGLTHPLIAQVMEDRVAEVDDPGRIVILDLALMTIAEKARFQLSVVIVVDTPEEVAVRRLMSQRGFSEEDAVSRVGAQISRLERRQLADLVLDNSGDLCALEAEIDRAWAWLQERATQA